MDAVEMTLLLDYYGDLLTDKQRRYLDLRYNQDLSLSEIAQELGVSRQGVFDNLSRAEQRLYKMEEKTGCVRKSMTTRRVTEDIMKITDRLMSHTDPEVVRLARQIVLRVQELEE